MNYLLGFCGTFGETFYSSECSNANVRKSNRNDKVIKLGDGNAIKRKAKVILNFISL